MVMTEEDFGEAFGSHIQNITSLDGGVILVSK